MKMIVSDLSQIEPRVLSWLVKDKVALDAMARGDTPYVAHAKSTMSWNPENPKWVKGNLKKEDLDIYALAKVRVLGLGYGAGWRKFITMAKSMAGLDITLGDPEWEPAFTRDGDPVIGVDGTQKMVSGYGQNSRRIVKAFRDSNPGVTGLWKSLDDAFKSAVGGDFNLTLPSGRTMVYKNVRSEWKLVPRSEDEDPLRRPSEIDVPLGFKRKLCFTADVGGMRSTFYGGLLTENLVQATARDVFAYHVLLLNSTPGITVLFTVHDEAVCEVASHVTAQQVQDIMSVTPPWLTGCPVTAEAKEVPCYEK